MTVIASLSSRVIDVRSEQDPLLIPFSGQPATVGRFLLTLTREAWPVGQVASVSVRDGNGNQLMAATLAGGDILDRQGNVATTSSISCPKPAGVTSGTVRAVINQQFRTAVTLERF